jgi:hypothetical protein
MEDEGRDGRAIKTVGRTIKPKARASVLLITLARAVVSGETATPHIRLRSLVSASLRIKHPVVFYLGSRRLMNNLQC